ncbi:MAG: hypothetical protein Tsb0013_11460 [Phycisphaerales bacterium]
MRGRSVTGAMLPSGVLRPGVHDLRIVRVPKGGDDAGARLAHALTRGLWIDDATVLKDTPGATVFDATLAGTPVVIKTMRLDGLADRVRADAGLSRLMRQWRGAQLLEKSGVRTAAPLVMCRGFGEDGAIVETLVIERIEGRSLLEHLRDRDLTDDEVRALTESMAVDLEAMWVRAFNRDHKPSNLIVERTDTGVRAAVVDTVGVRRLRGLGAGSNAKLARMLASLWIEAVGVGCPPSVREAYRLVCRVCDAPTPKGGRKPGWSRRRSYGFARTMWALASDIVHAHGDPTPRDSPFPDRHGGA